MKTTRYAHSSGATVTQEVYSNASFMTRTMIARKNSSMKLSNIHTSSHVAGFLLITSAIKAVSRRAKSFRLLSKTVTFKDIKRATLVNLSNFYLISKKSYYDSNLTTSLYQKIFSTNSYRKLNTLISVTTLKNISSDIIDSATKLISVEPSLISTVKSSHSKISKKLILSRYLGLLSDT